MRHEVIIGVERRRSWSDERKLSILSEVGVGGATVADVARRYGIAPQQLTAWRRLARQGKLALPVDEAAEQTFAALMIEDEGEVPAATVSKGAAPVEIEMDGVIVRLAGDAPATWVAEIAAALRAVR